MRRTCTYAALTAGLCASAQESTFQIALDPPGNNTFLQYADASLYEDGSTVILAQNSWSLPTPIGLVTKMSPDGSILWSRNVHPTSSTSPYLVVKRVLAMPDGGAAVFATAPDSMMAGSSFLLIRLDATGGLQWSKSFTPAVASWDWDYGYSTARPTADGGIVLNMGLTVTPTFVRLDPSGNVSWARSFITDDPDTSKVPTFDFGIDDNGGLIITEKANSDMMLIHTDASGNVLWSHRYASGLYTHTKIAVPLSNGDFLCSGYSGYPFAARVDAGGNIIWMRDYQLTGVWDGFHRIVELPDGDILLSARSNSTGSPMSLTDLVVRIDANGQPEGKYVAGSDLLSPAMELVGFYGGRLVLAGQATTPVDGGYEVYQMLWRVDEQFAGACGVASAIVPVTSSDLEPFVAMSDGCNAVDRVVTVSNPTVSVTNAEYESTDLCALLTGVPDHGQLTDIAIFPSPVAQGEVATIVLTGAAERLEVMAPDGRIIASLAVNARGRLPLSTAGWSTGLYLIRVTDHAGTPLASTRLMVE